MAYVRLSATTRHPLLQAAFQSEPATTGGEDVTTVQLPDWLAFVRRPFPSCNLILLRNDDPALIDSGYGSDIPRTANLLRSQGVSPAEVRLVLNTHHHSDHVGGNAWLQSQAAQVAAHAWEAALVNTGDRDACNAEWLDQPVDAYSVDLALRDGDVVDAGGLPLHVIHTPGHTLGSICLFEARDRVLFLGDAAHREDVGWVAVFREGIGSLQRAMMGLRRLVDLDATTALSGHGPAIGDPPSALGGTLRRYESWMADPARPAWHACKRIFAYRLMITNGMAAKEVPGYLLGAAWFRDHAENVFGMPPEEFVEPFIAEMYRSKAAIRVRGLVMAGTPYSPPPISWIDRASRHPCYAPRRPDPPAEHQ